MQQQDQVGALVLRAKESFSAINTYDLQFEAEAGFATQIITSNPYTLSVAMGNKQSVIDAVRNVAAIGLTLNPALRLAYLVPREKKICLDIGYLGLIELGVKSGSILWAQARIVTAGDDFSLGSIYEAPTHKFDPFDSERSNESRWRGAYVTARTPDGGYLTHTMSKDEILRIRGRSESWKSGKNTPWKTDAMAMWLKTVIKPASKFWPKSERVQEAVHYLNNEGGEGVESASKPTTPAETLDPMVEKFSSLSTVKEVMDYFKSEQAGMERDSEGYKLFREAANSRLAALRKGA